MLKEKQNTAIDLRQELSYRRVMKVRKIYQYRGGRGDTFFPACPRCNLPVEREYQSYCDRCGQRLGWEDFGKAVVILAK